MQSRGISTVLLGAAIVVVLVVAAAGYFLLMPPSYGGPTTSHSTSSSSTSSVSTSTQFAQAVACTTGQGPAADSSVSIADYAFTPGSVTISVGQSVQWTNNGPSPHTVTSDAGHFNSGSLSPGSVFTCTFHQAGTYNYHCSIHPTMTAVVKVNP